MNPVGEVLQRTITVLEAASDAVLDTAAQAVDIGAGTGKEVLDIGDKTADAAIAEIREARDRLMTLVRKLGAAIS